MRHLLKIVPLISTQFFLLSCGGDAAAAKNALASALALIGVSSPSASGSSSTAIFSVLSSRSGFEPQTDISSGDVKSAEEKVEAIVERLDATTAASCVSGLDVQFKNRPNLKCFGSQFAVSSTYSLTGLGAFNTAVSSGDFASGGSHPGGDSGMLVATEPDTGEACASATTNAYVSYAAQGVSISQDLFAAGLCLANLAGKTLPASGENLDLLDTIGSSVTGVTFTEFALSNDGTGYTLAAAGSSGSNAFSIKSINSKSDETDTGKVFGYYDIGSDYFGFSVSYSKTGDSATIDYRSSKSAGTNIVDMSTGALTFSNGSGDMFYIKLNGKQSDSEVDGAMLFAWQAGAGDAYARVFQSSVEGSSGEAYFGYGPRLSLSANEADYGEINGMICNWALTNGGDNQATQISTNANKAEKQTFDLSGGKFTPSVSNITYAPHPTCNGHTANYTMGVGQGSAGAFTADTFTGATWTIASSLTNNLVTISDGLGIDSDRRP